MFRNLDFDVIDEVKIGTGTHLRLIQTHKGNRRIESWSSLSKQWNVAYRYGVDEAWAGWKKTEKSINDRKALEESLKKAKPKRVTRKTKVEVVEEAPKPTRKSRKKKND